MELNTIEDYKAELNRVNNLLNLSNSKGLSLKEEIITLKQEIILNNDLPEELKRERAIMNYRMQIAKQFISGNAFAKMTPEQAFVIIEAGAEMGMKPMESMRDLCIINGGVGFYADGLINRVIGAGYAIHYLSETSEGVTVNVVKDDFDIKFPVSRNMEAFKSSKAIGFASLEKMRYHGVRHIVKFYLPHLVRGAKVGDEYAGAQALPAAETQKQIQPATIGLEVTEAIIEPIENKRGF